MSRTLQAAVAVLAALLGVATGALGFGKNKIAHRSFDWRLHRTEHLEVYYDPSAAALVPEVAAFAEAAYGRIAGALGLRELEGAPPPAPVPVLLFLSRADFEQTRILPGFVDESVRGFADTVRGRLVFPLDGPRRELEELIVHEMTHALTYRAVGSSALRRLSGAIPLWFLEGLAEYQTGPWAPWEEAMLRDALRHGQVVPLGRLGRFEALEQPFLGYLLGRAAVERLVERFGTRAIPQILQELRLQVRKSLPRALYLVTRLTTEELEQDLYGSLLVRFGPEQPPEATAAEASSPWPSPEARGQGVASVLSPAGELVAQLASAPDGLQAVVRRVRDGGLFDTLADGGAGAERLASDGWPLAWSPDGNLVAFAAPRAGRDVLVLHDLVTRGRRERLDLGLERVRSPAFHPDGRRVVVAGSLGGQSDLFVYDRGAGRAEALTRDEHFDAEPVWAPDGRSLVYSSERAGRYALVWLEASGAEARVLLDGASTAYQARWTRDGRRVVCVWDRSGAEEIWELDPATGAAARLSDARSRTGWPCPLPDGRILYSELRAGRWRLRTLPAGAAPLEQLVVRPPAAVPAAAGGGARLAGAAPLQARSAPLRVGLRDLGWALAWTDDERLVLAASAAVSDLFAERQLVVRLGSDQWLEDVSLRYADLRRRVGLHGAAGHRRRHAFFDGDRQRVSEQWAQLAAVYPLGRELRGEARLEVLRARGNEPWGVYGTEARTSVRVAAELVGDAVRYRPWGPAGGARFRLEAMTGLGLGEVLDERTLSADVRGYVPLLRRGVLAGRLAAGASLGPDPVYFSLGGSETVRGLELGELTGEHFLLANAELRFPLVDAVGLGRFALRGVRGAVFADAGTAWDGADGVDFWDVEPELRLRDLRASVGARASVRVGRLDLRLTAAWRTDLASIDGSPEVLFTIGTGWLY